MAERRGIDDTLSMGPISAILRMEGRQDGMDAEIGRIKSDALTMNADLKIAKANSEEILSILRGLKFWAILVAGAVALGGSILNILHYLPGK